MIKSNFREWTMDKIDDSFGTIQIDDHPALKNWLEYDCDVNEYEKHYISDLQESLKLGVDDWNEVELENKFISPLFMFVKFDNKAFSYFLERDLTASIGDYDLSGRVDGMIASGFRNPRKPFFCLNEYKKQTDPEGDPRGQVLIAMLAAQVSNLSPRPIYGCYIIGKMWRFLILVENLYAFSGSYLADNEEVFHIFRILKGLKHIIEQEVNHKPKNQ